jgi:hypothetical protein
LFALLEKHLISRASIEVLSLTIVIAVSQLNVTQ